MQRYVVGIHSPAFEQDRGSAIRISGCIAGRDLHIGYDIKQHTTSLEKQKMARVGQGVLYFAAKFQWHRYCILSLGTQG